MSSVNNPLSATSYTNKDFQTIYPELLEAAKVLAKNWDPTISNESDPGVVLLKLNAIIGDKNNYNIDKNVLENYPDTYTQGMSARSQYKQLGYKMPWYRASTVPVTFRWVGDELEIGQYVTVPRHTLLTDSSNEYVFTLLEDVTISRTEHNATVSGTGLVMQGVINRLSIAGSDVMTIANLDKNNRLYISESNIAENGIFVYSADDKNMNLWSQVYNVDTQHPSSKCYEFDVDPRSETPYIQFPNDIYSTIGKGIIVEYVTTDGYSGNVAAGAINSYHSELTITVKSSDLSFEEKKVPLNTSNIKLGNKYATTEILMDSSINTGSDPETIEDARISYKKLVGTFDTLVTLRDYMNAIYSMTSPELVSNVIVTDRTNDIQSSYKIISKYPSIFEHTTYMVEGDSVALKKGSGKRLMKKRGDTFSPISKESELASGEVLYHIDEDLSKDMSPFDLRLYLLKSGGILSKIDSYEDTFSIDNSTQTLNRIKAKLEDKKSVQHDFVPIKPQIPFMLQAIYPIKLKIIPSYKLDDVQQDQVRSNITRALMNKLNARKCEFGVEPDYDSIYNVIAESDERIKTVIMDDFEYDLFAVYLGHKFNKDGTETDEEEFKYVPVSDYSKCSRAVVVDKVVEKDKDGNFVLKESAKVSEVLGLLKDRYEFMVEKKVPVQELRSYMFIDAINGVLYYLNVEEDGGKLVVNNYLNVEEIEGGLVVKKTYPFVKYSDILNDLRKQIIAKNILAGVTPLYETTDGEFLTTIDMQEVGNVEADAISTNLTICPFGDKVYGEDTLDRDAQYTLKKNETIRCLAPSFIMEKSFSSYTKFEVTLASPLTSSSKYVYADPADEADILSRYGYSMFYEKDSNTNYKLKNSNAYIQLSSTPRIKLDSYYRKGNDGFGNTTYKVITDGNIVKTFENIKDIATKALDTKYLLDFEPYLYYVNDSAELVTSYPYGDEENNCWGSAYYSGCKKLRQYINPGSTFMPLGAYLKGMGVNKVDSFADLENHMNSYGQQIWVFTESDGYELLSGYLSKQSTDEDRNTIKGNIVMSLYGEEAYSDIDCYVDISKEFNSHQKWNLHFSIDEMPECYFHMTDAKFGTDVYKVIRSRGVVVGYEMVMLDADEEPITEISAGNEYVYVEQPKDWNSNNYAIKYTRSVSNGANITDFAEIKSIPTVPESSVSLYTLSDSVYVKSEIDASNWEANYSKYYLRTQFNGVHPSSQEYLLWKNKNLTLYVPEVTYKIPADTEYQLRTGDSVVFFWKDADESDAPYLYEKYVGGEDSYSNPIIKPNFTISAKKPGEQLINPNTLNSSGIIPYDGAENSSFSKVYSMYGEQDLGASRQIEIRKINQVRMTIDGNCKNRFYYFVTNDKYKPSTGKYANNICYRLVLDKVSSTNGKNRFKHILQADEYFFYINEDKTLYGVLGEGTLIDYTISGGEYSGDKLTLEVKAVDTFDISFRGISVFKENCVEITVSDDIKLIEQQVYSFTEGDTLQFSMKEDATVKYVKPTTYSAGTTYFSYIPIYSEVEPIQLSLTEMVSPPFIQNYYYRVGSGGVYTPLATKPDNWDDINECCNYYYLISSEFTEASGVNGTNYMDYYVAEIPTYPSMSTTSPLLLDTVEIHYSTSGSRNNSESGSKVFTALPPINVVDNEYKWSVTPYLNISTNSITPQKIAFSSDDSTSNRSVTIGGAVYNAGTTGDKDLYLLTNVPVERVGGTNTDISWMNLVGEKKSTNVYMYYLNTDISDSDYFDKLDDGRVVIEVGKNVSCYGKDAISITNMSLGSGYNHLLPIELTTDGVEVYLDAYGVGKYKEEMYKDYDFGETSGTISCICCNNGTAKTIHGKGKHFVKLPASTETLVISYRNNSNEVSSIQFNPVFKYKHRKLFDGDDKTGSGKYGITTADLEQAIQELDIPMEFDYCHIPSDDIRIDDPLDPSSVFEGSHVFNKFSIPRAELRTAQPFDATIEFVNNR